MRNPLSKSQDYPEGDLQLAPSPVLEDEVRAKLDALDEAINAALDALTARQRRFVEAYSASGNGAQAAISAGYSEHTAGLIAHENLTKLNIRRSVALLVYRRQLETGIDAKWKRMALAEIVRKALVQIPPDFTAATRAIALLCKMDGDYAPQIIEVRESVADKIETAKARVDAMLAHDGSGKSAQARAKGNDPA